MIDIRKQLLEKAGVQPHHKNCDRKLTQLEAFRISENDFQKLFALSDEVLRFLFIGTLTIANRQAFIQGMALNMSLAVKALTEVEVEHLVVALSQIERKIGVEDDQRSSAKWKELGEELAIGIEEDPTILLRRYWE